MIKQLLSKIHSLFYSNRSEWVIGIRNKRNVKLYEGNLEGFCIVKNKRGFWYADPFLYEVDDKTYLFAEQYNIKLGKGEIAVAEIVNGKVKKFRTCLSSPFHLSYPCVFNYNGDTIMCPECHQSGKISLFRTDCFPMEWRESEIIYRMCAADTTPCIIDGELVYFTTVYQSTKKEDIVDNNLCILKNGELIKVKEGNNLRMAGHIFVHNNKRMRPCQCNQVLYGEALEFRNFEFSTTNGIKEESVFKVYPPNTHQNSITLSKSCGYKDFIGLHTYNMSHQYEVIDLKVKSKPGLSIFVSNLSTYIKRAFSKLLCKHQIQIR